MKGVLDRFTDNDLAVILIESINKELVVPKKELPQGSKVNTWFTLKEQQGSYTIVSIDEQKTTSAADKSKNLADQLQAKKMKRSKHQK